MVTKVQFGIVVLLLLIIALIEVVPIASPTRPKWEYKTDDIEDERFSAQMDARGAEGWELVFARRAVGGPGEKPAYEVIFKRRQ